MNEPGQLGELEQRYPAFPHSASGGGWKLSGEKEWQALVNGYWTGGFWVGLLSLAGELTGDSEFGGWAGKWMEALEPRARRQGLHDLGFLFFPSAVLMRELGAGGEAAEAAQAAAANLAGRYSSMYRCLTIFERPPMDRILAIDTMMNLPLLWWAARETENEMWGRTARNHADTTAELLVRDDGAMFHIAKFSPAERKVDEFASWQGRAPDSCWSRGQAWAISGFAYSFFYTGDPAYREVFEKTLSFFRDNLPPDTIPHWDLLVEDNAKYEWDREPRDSSALAIAAHALLVNGAEEHRELAGRWLGELAARCLAPPGEPGLLQHVCFHRPANEDVDCACIFADFYFLLALAVYTGRMPFPYS